METKIILLSSLIVTAFLTGLIWFVQVVHYPSFGKVPPEGFDTFHHFHVSATGLVVMLPMLTELILAFAMLAVANNIGTWQKITLSGIVFALWGLTFFVFVPLHGQLSAGFNQAVIDKLVKWNWVRTFLWTVRLVGLSVLVFRG